MGETRCVTGKVVRVEQGNRGVHYLDFCEDFRVCPFTVAVFPSDRKKVGDVRQLRGRVVEIRGAGEGVRRAGRERIAGAKATQWRGCNHSSATQKLRGGTKEALQRGKFSHPKARHQARKKRHPAMLPIEIPEDEPD